MFDQSATFRSALLATGDAVLTHALGKGRRPETVLTEQEFCSRLMRLRSRLTEPRPAVEGPPELVDPTRAPHGRVSHGE